MIVQVCVGSSCHLKGSEEIVKLLQKAVEEYHLEKQLVTAEMIITMDKIPKIDFSFAYAHWKKRREESLEYLANALKDN